MLNYPICRFYSFMINATSQFNCFTYGINGFYSVKSFKTSLESFHMLG